MAETHSLLKACAAEEQVTASRRHDFGAFALESGPKLVGHYQIDRLLDYSICWLSKQRDG